VLSVLADLTLGLLKGRDNIFCMSDVSIKSCYALAFPPWRSCLLLASILSAGLVVQRYIAKDNHNEVKLEMCKNGCVLKIYLLKVHIE
jgi:hypothetical protein